MKELNFQNNIEAISSQYDKIVNCRIIQPTYDKHSSRTSEFMLDKRLGLQETKNKDDVKFYDFVEVEGKKYYYGINLSTNRGVLLDEAMRQIYSVPVDSDSPLKVAKGYGAGGFIVIDGSNNTTSIIGTKVTTPPVGASEEMKAIHNANVALQKSQPNYSSTNPDDGGFIRLTIPGCTTGQYIAFTDGNLPGAVNKIYFADASYIYILGTNVYGTLPQSLEKYYVFSKPKDNIVIGASDGLHVVSIIDSDPLIPNKYSLLFTPDSVSHWSFLLNGINVVITKTILSEIVTELSAQIGAGYTVIEEDTFISLYKNDGGIITFSSIQNGLVLDLNFMSAYVAGYPKMSGLAFTLDGTQYNFLAKNYMRTSLEGAINPNGYYAIASTASQSIYFDKNQLILDVIAAIPSATYDARRINPFPTLPPGYINFGKKWNFASGEVWINSPYEKIFISKKNKTALTGSVKNWNWYYFDIMDGSPNGYTSTTFTISRNGIVTNTITHTGTGSNLATYVASQLNAAGGFQVFEKYFDKSNHLLISTTNGDELSISVTFGGTSSIISSQLRYHNDNRPNYRFVFGGQDSALPYDINLIHDVTLHSGTTIFRNINDTLGVGYRVIKDIAIKDVVKYNGVIFALAKNTIFFSRINSDNNTNFAILDYFKQGGVEKLVPFGKNLLLLGDENYIISPTTITLFGKEGVDSYIKNDLEYSESLYSKYSYIYDQGSLYVVQSNKQIGRMSLIQNDAVSYSLIFENITKANRWILDDISGPCFVSKYDNKFHFLFPNNGTTTDHIYDIDFQFWNTSSYPIEIYDYRGDILGDEKIAQEGGYLDFGIGYNQEIYLSIGNLITQKRINIMRTIFGLVDGVDIDVVFDYEFELGNAMMLSKTTERKNYELNNRENIDLQNSLNLFFFPGLAYNGTFAAIQENIDFSGRFIRVKLHSDKRFIFAQMYGLYHENKTIVSEAKTLN